jgi:hypothetical protein
MGVLSADITPLGVVMTGDSQPVVLRESAYEILQTRGVRQRPCLMQHAGAGFTVVLGFVGTERIGGVDALAWLRRFAAANGFLDLDAFCDALCAALTVEWVRHGYDTVLWVFIAGASEGLPLFRAVRNCGPDMDASLLYTKVGRSFVWHNDLANHITQYGRPGETLMQTLGHTQALYRNGVLLPAIGVVDSFRAILNALIAGGYEGFAPIDSLSSYSAIVKMREEFVKRLFDRDKGVYMAAARPVAGTVYVWRVELDGSIYNHTPKKPSQIGSLN